MTSVNENPNEQSSYTQCQRILAYLQRGETVTSLEAVKLFQSMRLASRIHDLRSMSTDLFVDIQKVRVKDDKTAKHFDAYYSESAIKKRYGVKDARMFAYSKTMARLNGAKGL